MSRQTLLPQEVEHPEVLAIAVELILYPARRQRYSPRILMLADAAIDHLQTKLQSTPAARTDDP
jgi:hypothetical protein